MEWLGWILNTLVNIAILALIVWAIVRAMGGRRAPGQPVDHATSVRRLFLYGLLLVTLLLTATGAVLVFQELLGTAPGATEGERAPLALGLAFVIVAAPAYGFLLRHARRRLHDPEERRSLAWAAYLNLSLLVSLIVTIVAAQQLLEEITGVDHRRAASVVPLVVWGAVWAAHWFWLKAVHGLPGDVHLAAGSLAGLVMGAIGAGGLTFVVGDEVYAGLVEQVPAGHHEPDPRSWAIAAGIGAAVWSWHWLARYLHAERTALWHVLVVLIGALGGLIAALAAAATMAYWTITWFLGDPPEALSSEHFELVPVAAAVLVVGAGSWQYHRAVLQRRRDLTRTEPLRAYDYLMAGAGLVAVVVGLTLALVAMLEALTPEPAGSQTAIANRLVLAGVLAVIGGPLWWVFWSRIRRHAIADPVAELGSAVRRIYLIVLFGVGGVVALVSLISVLFIGLEDLLDGSLGGGTLRSCRVGLSLLATVTGVAWYHLGVFRGDRDALAAVAPTPSPPPARHVVLVAPRGTALAEAIATATHAELDTWYRTDDTVAVDIDPDRLVEQIEASDAGDLLVVVGADGATVVPVET